MVQTPALLAKAVPLFVPLTDSSTRALGSDVPVMRGWVTLVRSSVLVELAGLPASKLSSELTRSGTLGGAGGVVSMITGASGSDSTLLPAKSVASTVML